MISGLKKILGRLCSVDRFLVVAIAAALISGIQGLNWGVYSCLNPDQMALRRIKAKPALHPGSFDKPPLLTYINNTLVNEPTKVFAQLAIFLGADKHNTESARQRWRVILGRLLQALFYSGIVVFAYLFARDWFGIASARATSLLLGTCAGFVPFKIFLTADISLAFWMTACLYFCGRIISNPASLRFSLLAGACAGFATATKYNGLGVAIALPLAYLLAPGGFRAALHRKTFYLCGLAVPFAFILANPYSILDASKFVHDFMFNYTVTPVYGGDSGTGYTKFFGRFPEIFGRPLTWLLLPVATLGWWSLRAKIHSNARCAMFLLIAVFVFYFWKIGSFPRMETRFVLPVAPIVFLIIAPGWQVLSRRPGVLPALIAPLCLYGSVSGWFIGQTFSRDARMNAVQWARVNMSTEAKVETAGACPKWKFLEDHDIEVREFPEGMTRDSVFREKMGDNKWVTSRLDDDEQKREPGFFTPEGLRHRSPDYITLDSFYIGEKVVSLFIGQLLRGELGYRILFEQDSPLPPPWVYPRQPDFTGGTFYILVRD